MFDQFLSIETFVISRQITMKAGNGVVSKAGGYTGRQNCISNIVQHTNEEGYGHGIWRI